MKPIKSSRMWIVWVAILAFPLGGTAFRPAPPARLMTTAPAESAPEMAAAETVEALDLAMAAADEELALRNAQLLVDAIIQIESNGNPRMVGRHGERGLMQIRAGTWRDMTTRLFGRPLPFDRAFEPELNRRVGTAYLAYLQEMLLPQQAAWKSDERSLLLAAYNAGPGALRQTHYNLAQMPRQTRDYVARASALHDVYTSDIAQADTRELAAAL
jgi:soluble lytic murein transglycosylase-like protein